MYGNGKLTKLTIPNKVQLETSYKLAAEEATALSWSDPNLTRINPHQTGKKKHIAAVKLLTHILNANPFQTHSQTLSTKPHHPLSRCQFSQHSIKGLW